MIHTRLCLARFLLLFSVMSTNKIARKLYWKGVEPSEIFHKITNGNPEHFGDCLADLYFQQRVKCCSSRNHEKSALA